MWHDTGEVFVEDFYEAILDGAANDIGRAENHAEGFQTSVAGICRELRAIQDSGARYVVTTDKSGRFDVRIVRPNEGVAAALARGMLDTIGAGDDRHAEWIALTLNQLPASGTRIHSSIREVEWRQFGAVQDLLRIRGGESVKFKQPGVSLEAYSEMLEVLVVALERDLAYLRGLELGVLGVLLVAQGAHFENPYALPSISALLLATLDDADVLARARPAFVHWPPSAEIRADIPAQAAEIVARVSTQPAYTEWQKGGVAVRELKAFASDAGTDLRAFGALSGMMTGVEVGGFLGGGAVPLDVAQVATTLASSAREGSATRVLLTTAASQATAASVAGGGLVLVTDPDSIARIESDLRSRGLY